MRRTLCVLSTLIVLVGIGPAVGGHWVTGPTTAWAGRAAARRSGPRPARGKTKSARRQKRSRERFPPMRLVDVNSGRKLSLRPYDKRGRINRGALRTLRNFMRCRRTGRRHAIAWGLVRNMYKLSRDFPGKRLYVYSGFRHRSIARSPRSRHTKGRAVDLSVEGVSNRRLRDHIRARFAHVGVGYYPNSSFVHMDVRPKRSAFWVDLSGPGERPRYAPNPNGVVRRERAARRALRRIGRTPRAPLADGGSAAVPATAAIDSGPPLVLGPPPLGPAPVAAVAPMGLRAPPGE